MAEQINSKMFNRTTFSGSDITVVAYRNRSTPAENFDIEDKEKEIKQIDKELKELELKEKIARRLTNLDVELTSEYESQNLPGLTPPSSLVSNQGKTQNNFRLLNEENTGITEKESQIKNAIERRTKLEDDVSKKQNIANIILENIHTISYSSFREKFAVRSLGRTHAKTYTRGPRTIAGTMVFNTSQEQELMKLVSLSRTDKDSDLPHPGIISVDQIPVFDLMLLFANEYGAYSALHMFNIDIASEGQEMSIDNLLTQNTLNFYATDIVPMQNIGSLFNSYADMISKSIIEAQKYTPIESRKTNIKEWSKPDIFVNNKFNQEKSKIGDLLSQSRGLF